MRNYTLTVAKQWKPRHWAEKPLPDGPGLQSGFLATITPEGDPQLTADAWGESACEAAMAAVALVVNDPREEVAA